MRRGCVRAVSRAWQSKNKTKEESSGAHLLLTAVQTCQPDVQNSNTTLGQAVPPRSAFADSTSFRFRRVC